MMIRLEMDVNGSAWWRRHALRRLPRG